MLLPIPPALVGPWVPARSRSSCTVPDVRARLRKGEHKVNSQELLAAGEVAAWQGWVGPAAIVTGLLLLIVALVRRSRVTLARKRRAASSGAVD
jgi:hypothetical protein